jgi:hypothetical protein
MCSKLFGYVRPNHWRFTLGEISKPLFPSLELISLSLYLYHLLALRLPATHFEVAPYVMYVAAVTKTDQTACNVW